MRVDSDRVIELLREKDNILILTHRSPDGDTLGCGTALCRVLIDMGKKARVENSEEIPSKYDYLFEDLPVLDFEPAFIIAVDVADTKLLGDKLSVYADKIDLCIDHHGSNPGYAKELYLMPDDGAAALTLYRILKKMGADITPHIANSLYTGLSTDTGCFKYSNANSEAYRAAADLIDLGAENAAINVMMFETKPIEYFKLLTEVLANMRMFCDGQCAVFKITQEMFDRTGATPDCCDAISALSRQIEGVKIGITMKEREGGKFKFSLRTHEPLDASELCRAFGGGGHKRAAGCDPDRNEEEVLGKLVALIEERLKSEQV